MWGQKDRNAVERNFSRAVTRHALRIIEKISHIMSCLENPESSRSLFQLVGIRPSPFSCFPHECISRLASSTMYLPLSR